MTRPGARLVVLFDVHPLRLAVLLIALMTHGAAAQTSRPEPLATPDVLQALTGSTLTIRGSTTVGKSWSCRAANVLSRAAVGPPDHSGTRPEIPEVRGVTIHVAVSALRCQNGMMERAMRHALRADRDTAAQSIIGVFEIYDEMKPVDPRDAHLAGALRVAGAERNVFLHARIEPRADALYVRSVVALMLSSFGIDRPRVLFGAVRARDAITVEVELRYPHPK
jgi:hypothetical protein